MSYSFYSLVSSIKDKSSQAITTLSSDLKEFTSIVQEDVAEVAKTVRKTVHEQSEALRQRVEEQQRLDEDSEAENGETAGDEDASALQSNKEAAGDDGDAVSVREDEDAETPNAVERRSSITSMFSFAGLSLESMGSKILQSADGLLETLTRAGAVEGEVDEDEDDHNDEDELASARRYRLLALQEDEHTYIHPPMDLETFKKWRKALAEEELASIQEEVLAHYPTVGQKLAGLVPDLVSEDDFWAHYIYKASLLAAQEQRGADLLEHALNDSEEEVGWDAESPRRAKDNDGRFPTYDDASADEALPILEAADMPEPSSPAPVLGERRRVLHDRDDEDSPAPMDSVSSDGESWIELDEQRKDALQPPLSSSSTSSFVPVYGPRDGVYTVVGGDSKLEAAAAATAVSTAALMREDDEEDVDWGDGEEGDAAASTKPPGKVSAAIETPVTKARGPDWGEWD